MAIPDVAPFNRFLGVKVLHRSAERTEAQLVVREELCNRRGVLHGGAIMALGDALGGMTAVSNLPDGSRTATIESKTKGTPHQTARQAGTEPGNPNGGYSGTTWEIVP